MNPAPSTPGKFRAADVEVVRGYFVVCHVCGEDVSDYGGHGLPDRAAATEERRAHIAEFHKPSAARESAR